MKNHFLKKYKQQKSFFIGGFSIIELMVSIGIFALLSGMVMINQGGLSGRTNVDSIAHQIAQWIRDAQISSMSVRLTRAGNDAFTSGYGVHFDTANPNRFIFFADRDKNGIYQVAGGDTAEDTINLLQNYRITSLCGAHSNTGALSCDGMMGFGATDVLDISFKRPNPDANIMGDDIGIPASKTYSPARITVTSPKGVSRTVVVYATGQVSIQ